MQLNHNLLHNIFMTTEVQLSFRTCPSFLSPGLHEPDQLVKTKTDTKTAAAELQLFSYINYANEVSIHTKYITKSRIKC